MDSHGSQCSCSSHRPTPSVHQTLEEMDFGRGTSPAHVHIFISHHVDVLKNCLFLGIWSAAMDGDVERVRAFIKKGIDPDMRDQTNYSALVCLFYNPPLIIILIIS